MKSVIIKDKSNKVIIVVRERKGEYYTEKLTGLEDINIVVITDKNERITMWNK